CAVSLCLYQSPPPASLFPYTTLFRSGGAGLVVKHQRGALLIDDQRIQEAVVVVVADRRPAANDRPAECRPGLRADRPEQPPAVRSEEHTSELQSRENLVCRLLLEKKK